MARSTADKLSVHVLASDERIREAGRALDGDRFTVDLSSDPAEAYAATGAGCDVLVLELRLNGFSVVREIRSRSSTANTKVVMLVDRHHDRWLSEQAGADYVIVKPLPDTSTLERAIREVLGSP